MAWGDDGTLTKSDVEIGRALRVGPPTSVILVTSISRDGKPNIITLGMYMPISTKPPLLAIGVSPRRYSHRLIKDAGEFVINVPPMRLIRQVVLCGESSGRDRDKFKLTGLTPKPSKKVRPPLIEECVSHLECKVVRSYRAGDHTLFLGRVVGAKVEDGMMDDALDVMKAKTIIHKGGSYFTPKLFYRA